MADEVDVLLRKYTNELRAVISRQLEAEVTAAVRRAFSGTRKDATGAPARRAPGAVAARTGKPTNAPKKAPAKPAKESNGGRRSPAKLARQTKRLLAHIKDNPGQRSEQISAATKISTSELALPLKKLVAEKKIKSSGVARGTTYTPVT